MNLEYEVTKECNVLPSPTERGGLLGIECKFVRHIPADPLMDRQDMHYIKEVYHYKDGSSIRNLRPLANYQRSFWLTKEHKRNHEQKKESEELENVNEYKTTQSDLIKTVASRLGGKYIGCKQLRDITANPYIYGIDVTSSDEIAYKYTKKYPNITMSPCIVAAFDIENHPDTKEICVITVAMHGHVYTAILKKFLPHTTNVEEVLHKLFTKHIPDSNVVESYNVVYEIFDTEVEVIKAAVNQAHQWQPDFLAIWNMDYDISCIIERLQEFEVDPKDVFSDPRVKENYRYFKYKKPNAMKMSASGVNKSPKPHENWPVVITPASFYLIDAMCAYNYIRAGQKQVPGGYSLDNILYHNLGKEYKKLKFEDDNVMGLVGYDWHIYMQEQKPLEYIIYNQWDVISMLLLDEKTQDLVNKIGALSGISSYDVFKSGPQKLVTDLHFYGLEHGRVSGVADRMAKDDRSDFLGNDNWIVMLPVDRTIDMGAYNVKGAPKIHTNMNKAVGDIDQTAGYPSDGQACNVSKDTTIREVVSIGKMEKSKFKINNINFMFGKVNHANYMMDMCGFPSFDQLHDKVVEIKNKKTT